MQPPGGGLSVQAQPGAHHQLEHSVPQMGQAQSADGPDGVRALSLIHISEPTRLGMISYAVFCLKKKKIINITEPTRRNYKIE